MTNAMDDSDVIISGFVTGVYIPFWTRPGFVIPIVRKDARSNTTYAQMCDVTGKVTGFKETNSPFERILPQPVQTRVGDDEIFSIVDQLDQIHLGKKKEIVDLIMAHRLFDELRDKPLTLFAFAKFCDDFETVQQALEKIFNTMIKEAGITEFSIERYIISTSYIELKNIIASSSRVPVEELDLCVNVSIKKKKVTISLESELGSGYNISNISKKESIFDISINAILRATSGTLTVSIGKKDTRIKDAANNFKKTNNITDVQSLPRQEQRYVRVVKAILDDFDSGMSLLKSYRDKTQFVDRSLERLLEIEHRLKQEYAIDNEIATELLTLVGYSYPRLRKKLLIEIVKCLGDNKAVNNKFKLYVISSKARWIKAIRDEVLNLLKVNAEK